MTKRGYSAPKLTVYGNVKQLTMGYQGADEAVRHQPWSPGHRKYSPRRLVGQRDSNRLCLFM